MQRNSSTIKSEKMMKMKCDFDAFCLCIDSAYAGKSTCTTALNLLKQSDTLLTQYRHIEHLC